MIGVTLRDSSGRSFRASRRRWAIAGANMRTRGALIALPLRSTQPTAEPQQKASQKDYQPANNSGANAEPDDSRLLHDGCPCRDAAAPPASRKSSAEAPQRRAWSDGARACHPAHRRWSGHSRQQPARRARGHPLGCGLLAYVAARFRRFTRRVLNGSVGLLDLVSVRREVHRSGPLGQPCEVQGELQELAARVIIPLALGKRAKFGSPLR